MYGVALAAMGTVGIAQQAQAAYVVIRADPEYGAQFPGLSWRAIGALYIPNGCLKSTLELNTPPGTEVNPLTITLGSIDTQESCTNSKIQDVQLQFYKTGTTDVVDTIKIGDYTADTPPPNTDRDLTIQELIAITFKDGLLNSFSTTLSKPLFSAAASAFLSPLYGSGEKCFALELSSATSRVESFDYNSTTGTCSTAINTRPASDATDPATKPTITFDTIFRTDAYTAPQFAALQTNGVPEPASLGLTALALAALVAARRRRA